MVWFSRTLLKLCGWRLVGEQTLPQKCIIIFAPHTSNWDFFWMFVVKLAWNLKISYLGKHTLFKGPWAFFFKMTGGIPVYRATAGNMVEGIIEQFNNRDHMRLALAPEGTRSKTDHWKSGFYHIAVQAKIPIVCTFMDFKTSTLGIGKVFMPSGIEQQDLETLRQFYLPIQGKNPELTSTIGFKE